MLYHHHHHRQFLGLKGDLIFLVINIYAGLMVHLVVEECKNIHWTIIGIIVFILSIIFLGIAIHSFIAPTTGDEEYFETHSLW
jgi:hypothetical protein